jgi:hypothetical protein
MQSIQHGNDLPAETESWLRQVYEHGSPSEHRLIRVSIFNYHCTRICCKIQKLIKANDLDALLAKSSEVLYNIDTVEQETHPLSDAKPITDFIMEPPMLASSPKEHIEYVCLYIYQASNRMLLALFALNFVAHALKAPACTPQQRDDFTSYQVRCVTEYQAIATKVLALLSLFVRVFPVPGVDLVTQMKKDTRASYEMVWSNILRVIMPLRLIAAATISLDWQRDAAGKILEVINGFLGLA